MICPQCSVVCNCDRHQGLIWRPTGGGRASSAWQRYIFNVRPPSFSPDVYFKYNLVRNCIFCEKSISLFCCNIGIFQRCQSLLFEYKGCFWFQYQKENWHAANHGSCSIKSCYKERLCLNQYKSDSSLRYLNQQLYSLFSQFPYTPTSI